MPITNPAGERALELAVVVPTFNELENVEPFLAALEAALEGISYEVIFVDDDSPDGTAACVRRIGLTNPRIRVLQRIRRRGLSSACIEGMLATSAPYIAVMDGDLQHDERVLPAMLAKLKEAELDIVVATRNADGGSMGSFASHRVFLSNLGQRLSRWASRAILSDPMSGYFVLDRRYLDEVVRSTSGVGFKVLLDLVASAHRPVRIGETPFTFRERLHGASKLDILVGLEYLQLLLEKKVGRFIPVRFVLFAMVGMVGLAPAAAALLVCVQWLHMGFAAAQVCATAAAMALNFFLNNALTYRDRRLKGSQIWLGLLTFCAACSLGAVINLRIAELGRSLGLQWWIAGCIGLGIGAVWNYGVTSFSTWRRETVSAIRGVKEE